MDTTDMLVRGSPNQYMKMRQMIRSSNLNLEAKPAHAREVLLYQILALLVGFGRVEFEEAVVTGGFSLWARATSIK